MDGSRIAFGMNDGTVYVLTWKLEQLLKLPQVHGMAVTSIGFNASASCVITASSDGIATVHHVPLPVESTLSFWLLVLLVSFILLVSFSVYSEPDL